MLVDAGADPNQRDGHGRTAIYSAIERGSFAAVKVLLDLGADPNQADEDGVTPMKMASKYRRGEMIKLMRKAGGEPAGKRRKQWPTGEPAR